MTPDERTLAALLAELASCRLARVADRLVTGEQEAARELLAEARRALAQVEAAMARKDGPP